MNKKLLTLLTSAVSIVALSACIFRKDPTVYSYNFFNDNYRDNDYFAVKKINYYLAEGETKQIDFVSFPTSYGASEILFTSQNPEIVSVNASGVLTANKAGSTDVIVSSKDGSISKRIGVAVTKTTSKDVTSEVVSKISNTYESASHSKPTSFVRHEYSEEFYYKEGVKQYGNESDEVIGYDSERGYLFIDGPYVTYRVPGGSPEVSTGKWLFYTISDGAFTRCFHITKTVKNYFDLNTALYETNDAAIRGILDVFFVSGSKIVNDALDAYYGKDDFDSLATPDDADVKFVDNESVVVNYIEKNSDTVSAEDELKYFNIPTDTLYNYEYDYSFYNRNGRTESVNIDMTMSYKLGNENWERVFNRSQLFEEEFEQVEIQQPDKNGYKLVESLYDL